VPNDGKCHKDSNSHPKLGAPTTSVQVSCLLRCRKSVDLFAVGTAIYTTNSKDTENPVTQGFEYVTETGTSFAAPMVAGAAMLMASATGNRLTGAQLKALLRQTVDKLPALKNKCISGVRSAAPQYVATSGRPGHKNNGHFLDPIHGAINHLQYCQCAGPAQHSAGS
jgi:subtilisin family serine protease